MLGIVATIALLGVIGGVHQSVLVPVAAGGHTLHRFFDTSASSPSGRYLAYLRLPNASQSPSCKDCITYSSADIIVDGIVEGGWEVVETTHAWDTQLGAQLQWGSTDTELFYNVLQEDAFINTEAPRGVDGASSETNSCSNNCAKQTAGRTTIRGTVYNLKLRTHRLLQCPIYHVTSDGSTGVAPNLLKLHHTQKGYGVRLMDLQHVNNRNINAPLDDGIYLTNLTTGECSLYVSLHELASAAGMDVSATPTYGFHTKFSFDGTLLMVVVRTLETPAPPRQARVRVQHLFVIHLATRSIRRMVSWSSYPFIPRQCAQREASGQCPTVTLRDGNHPNWVPGTHKISMNLQVQDSVHSSQTSGDSSAGSGTNRATSAGGGGSESGGGSAHLWHEHLSTAYAYGKAVVDKGKELLLGGGQSNRRGGGWSIVTIDVDAHSEHFIFHYSMEIALLLSAHIDGGVKTADHDSARVNTHLTLPYTDKLVVRVDHSVGTGHPTYHISGDYILTDAYPKEVHLLTPPPGQTALKWGHVPLRLIHIPTQREAWLATVGCRLW